MFSDGVTPRILWAKPAERAESDCACPDPGAYAGPAALPYVPAESWGRARGLYQAPLDAQHELAFNPVGQTGVVVLNRAAGEVLRAYARPRTLTQARAALPQLTAAAVQTASEQLAALELLTTASRPVVAPRPDAQTLTAWLHVTNVCNLRCAYCYLHKTNAAMDEPTGRAAIAAVFRAARQHSFRAVKLKYAGGEATLNFSLIQTLHALAVQQAQAMGVQLREVVLSNGVALTAKMLAFLRAEAMPLMISLDGVGAPHDAHRTFANGAGSFRAVARAIDRACALGLRPHLSITVTPQNVEALAEAVTFALERDLLFNLNFFRDTDCAGDPAAWRMDEARWLAGMRRAFAVIEARLPRRSLLTALVDRTVFDAPHQRACGAGHHYLVIDERGGVARCQMEIEQTVTTVAAEDPLLAVQSVSAGFQNLTVDEKEGCQTCQWRYWCAGGCSLLTYKLTGRNDVKSPHCHLYQALYPEVLRLEALRLAKWASD